MANEIIKTMNEKDFTAEEIQAFNEQYLEGMKKIAHLEHVKKSFEEQEKTIKEQLQQCILHSIFCPTILTKHIGSNAEHFFSDEWYCLCIFFFCHCRNC